MSALLTSLAPLTLPKLCCVSLLDCHGQGAVVTGDRVRSEAPVKTHFYSCIGLVLWNHTDGVQALLLEITKVPGATKPKGIVTLAT